MCTARVVAGSVGGIGVLGGAGLLTNKVIKSIHSKELQAARRTSQVNPTSPDIRIIHAAEDLERPGGSEGVSESASDILKRVVREID